MISSLILLLILKMFNTTVFYQSLEIFRGSNVIYPVSIFLPVFSIFIWLFYHQITKIPKITNSPKTSNSPKITNHRSGNRKNRDKVINELRGAVLKNSASVESFALMVGALMKKVETLEYQLMSVDDYIKSLDIELDIEDYLKAGIKTELKAGIKTELKAERTLSLIHI